MTQVAVTQPSLMPNKIAAALAGIAILLLTACQPAPQSDVIGEDGNPNPKYSFSDEAMSPDMKAKFEAHISENNGTIDFKKMPPDLRAALIAGAKPIDPTKNANQRTRPTNLPPELAQFRLANFLDAPSPDRRLVGPVQTARGKVNLSDLRSGYHLLTFWATSCAPCLVEMKDFASLSRSLTGSGLTIAAVQTEGHSPDLAAKTKIALDKAGDISGLAQWRDATQSGDGLIALSKNLPLTILIGPDGQEVARMEGMITSSETDAASIWGTEDARKFVAQLQALGAAQRPN